MMKGAPPEAVVGVLRRVARTLITEWNAGEMSSDECAAELRGALFALGVLTEDDLRELTPKDPV